MNTDHIALPINTRKDGFTRGKNYLVTIAGFLTWVSSTGRRLAFVLRPVITPLTPLTGTTITTLADLDETLVLTPAGTLAELTIQLPAATDSQLGQIKRINSTAIVSALTISVAGSGSVTGAALTAAAVNTPYAFQCVSVAGAGVWMRIQ
jgi:hypothetical protein